MALTCSLQRCEAKVSRGSTDVLIVDLNNILIVDLNNILIVDLKCDILIVDLEAEVKSKQKIQKFKYSHLEKILKYGHSIFVSLFS
jgi:hypothetical protein